MFARDALDLWSDVSGLNFREVSSSADIVFTHGFSSGQAFADSNVDFRWWFQPVDATL